jgi:Tfp pilus assembly protein PilX
MKIQRSNQDGASVLMLAIFFIIIISIITVGFATLARREQRAVLDKTLSKQAQYAAESGINAVKNYVDKVGSTSAQSNASCDPTANAAVNTNYQKPDFSSAGGTGVNLSCLTWNIAPSEVSFKLENNSNLSFNNQNQTGYSLISWTTDGGQGNYTVPAGSTKLPNIDTTKDSILKMVTVIRGDVYAQPKVVTAYFVPADVSRVTPAYTTPTMAGSCPNTHPTKNDYVDLGDACIGTANVDSTNGLVYYIPCSSATCSIHVAGYTCPSTGCLGFGAAYKDRLFYFQNLGTKPATITYSAITNPYTAAEAGTPLTNIAVKVDANAIAQDVSKRLVAYIPIGNESWQPWFSALSDSLCKDYKVNGTSNNTAITGPSACPN